MKNITNIGKNGGLPDLKIKLTQKDADALNGPFVRPISTNMVEPTKLKLDSAGNIFVCESGANRISKILFVGARTCVHPPGAKNSRNSGLGFKM